MYAPARCLGRSSYRNRPRCVQAATVITKRQFHATPNYKYATPPSDPPSTRDGAGEGVNGGDKSSSKAPSSSRWRRRQIANARATDSYMIVDPATNSAEIIERTSRQKAHPHSKRSEPYQTPEWFSDCVHAPYSESCGSPNKQVVFLSSKQRHVTGMSFVSDIELEQVPNPSESGEGSPAPIEDKDRVWIDPGLYNEIDGVVRTSLSLDHSGELQTPLSLRSTISIHSPLDGSMSLLEDIVAYIASTQDAVLLKLNAQDLAELGGQYVSPKAGLDQSLQTLAYDTFAEVSEEEVAEENDAIEEEESGEDEASSSRAPVTARSTIILPTAADLPTQIGRLLKSIASFQKRGHGQPKKEERTERPSEEDSEPIMDQDRLENFLNALIDGAAQNGTSAASPKKLIISISDFIAISQTAIGNELIEKLASIVQQRRSENGEKICIVGLSVDKDILETKDAEKMIQWETDHSIWRTFIVLPHSADGGVILSGEQSFRQSHAQRNMLMNLRSWYTASAHMAPTMVPDRESILHSANNELGGALSLSKSVLTRDEIQRLATASIAKALVENRPHVNLNDLVAVTNDCRTIDTVRNNRLQRLREQDPGRYASSPAPGIFALPIFGPTGGNSSFFDPSEGNKSGSSASGSSGAGSDVAARLQALQRDADRYEKRLINGVVLPERIKTTFDQVHVAKDTVEAVRDLTALSLKRPDAFKYGVLATNNLSGLLLYGPPGTGKTMLARAVAKDSQATVLTVTGSDVNNMYVGESEKTVKAIFSLARKLSPCIVFIDEADALLASRGTDTRGGRPNHRDTINQFLLEWDGINENGVFFIVATNRPFDLDDAVLRRLPRRVLVDLPTKDDREAILRIHLNGESLGSGVDVIELAERTPYYSGSDLKNLVVSAALTAVKEELDAAKAHGEGYEYPEKRVLEKQHFDKAMGEIGASVSGDMASLRQIKKFDEQYGDRKGRKKKNPYGFIPMDDKEGDARVRG